MSEATQAAPETQPEPFNLAEPFFDLAIPVTWPGKDGKITVTHRLSRPTLKQETEYNRRGVSRERHLTGGKVSEEANSYLEAMAWLWDEIAVTIGGYPGLPDNTEATKEIKSKMRSAHKELAIASLFQCDAEILPEESIATFDGGEWAVRLRLGASSVPYLVLKLRMREWTEKERRAFEKGAAYSNTEVQGKSRLATSGVNHSAFDQLFDALFLSVAVDESSPEENVVIDKTPLKEAGKEVICKTFLGQWKVEVVTQLAQLWRKKLSD